jgi:hypothetical protein
MSNLIKVRKQFYEAVMVAHEDMVTFSPGAKRKLTQSYKRAYYRASFAFVEMTLFAIKHVLFDAAAAGLFSLSDAERAVLEEVNYDLADSGEIRTRRRFQPFEPKLRFIINLFHKLFDTYRQPNFTGPEWKVFQLALKVRNRVTHPKSAKDLEITNAEMTILEKANDWYWEVFRWILAVVSTQKEFQPTISKKLRTVK